MENCLPIGAFICSSVAAAAACVSAYASIRAVLRQEKLYIPRASVETICVRNGVASSFEIVVSNIGAVAFTVVAVGVDETILRGSKLGTEIGLPERTIVKTIPPGGNARYERPAVSGTAWVRIADGSVFTESTGQRHEAKRQHGTNGNSG
jgi:hypothetical protein